MQAQDMLSDAADVAQVNGAVVRKGTVGAFLANARCLMASAASETENALARQHIIEALPALQALGVFEVFALRDPAVRAFVDDALTR